MISELVSVTQESDVAIARIAGGRMADRVGFDTIDKHCLITSISELATNALFHAGGGHILIAVLEDRMGKTGVEVVAADHGGGIEDVALALTDGYSTNGGLGGGLPGVERMMSELQIASHPEVGTTVRALKWRTEPLCQRIDRNWLALANNDNHRPVLCNRADGCISNDRSEGAVNEPTLGKQRRWT